MKRVMKLMLSWLILVHGGVNAQEASTERHDGDGERLKVLACQVALEGAGFSAGLLDGVLGQKTETAVRAFQQVARQNVTGKLDEPTLSALNVLPERSIAAYTITAEDEHQVSYCPADWLERSQRERLLYPSLANMLAEKFHTSERCLAWLNPSVDLSRLKAGDSIVAPAPRDRGVAKAPATIEIDLERKLVLLFDAGSSLQGLLHCSVAKDLSAVERGESSVGTVVEEPGYTFDPKKWPEVKDVDRKLSIPPGPRSPVGLRWIGLDRPGVGIHGTPEPQNIGKTGSHGCFRLTNWDVVYLASVVKVGTKVRIVDRSSWGQSPF